MSAPWPPSNSGGSHRRREWGRLSTSSSQSRWSSPCVDASAGNGNMSLFITAVACAAAALCAFQIWRMMRAERQRSEARVAALAAAIDPPGRADRSGIFDERTRMPAGRHPLLKVAIGFAAVVTLIIVVAMANDL